MTKSATIQKCQEIRDSYQDGISLKDEDFEFIDNLLRTHRWYRQKVGIGYYEIFPAHNEYNNRAFFIRRHDNTTTDFSFYECVYPSKGYRSDFIKGARAAIAADIEKFKIAELSKGDWYECEICGSLLRHENSHVDHLYPEFRDLITLFIMENNLKDFEKLTTQENWDNVTGAEITDITIRNKWIAFHNKFAKLRLICITCNLSRKKK